MDQLSDSALVELARAGDKEAFAELYTRWFDPVYDFLARMMRNRDEAEDVAQDSFLKAMHAIGGLQKGASFKSWIFTIARNSALNRIEKSGRTRPLVFQDEEGEDVSLDVVDTDRFGSPEEAAEAQSMAALVWEASAGLDPKQLSLLELHLRKGFDSSEIADVLGVTKNNGYVMLNRLKKAVEDAIGAFIMFKDGRRYCDDLDSLLSVATVSGMSPDVRKLVDGHVSQCHQCEERKKKLVSPLAVFGAFAAVPAPMGARAHILEGLMRDWPGPAVGSGGEIPPPPDNGPGALPGDSDGVDRATFANVMRRGGRFIVAGAAAAVLFLFGLFVFPVLSSGGEGGDATSNDASPVPTNSLAGASTATATSTRPGISAGLVTPTATGTPVPGATSPAGVQAQTRTPTNTVGPGTPTATRTATPTATAPSTRPATSTPTATATATTTPCLPSLSTNTSTLNIAPGGGSSFLLLASCGSANYSVSGGDGWAIAAGSGSVAFGSPKTLQVNVDASALSEGPHSTTIAIAGPNNTTFVTVNTSVGGASPSIGSFSVSCSPSTPDRTFRATITDDVAVASATVNYTIAPTNSQGSLQLQHQGGGIWLGTITVLTPSMTISSATLTATDFAGHTDFATAGC